MLKNLWFLLTLSVAACASAQSFEGKIIYSNSYKSKKANMTDERLTKIMGSRQEYYTKGGDYKCVYNGTMLNWELYLNKDNKVYSQYAVAKNIAWNDCSKSNDEVLQATITGNVIRVLGDSCRELVLNCKSGKQIFYFDPKLAVNAELFSKHKYANLYEYLKRTHCLPLKIIIDNDDFYAESIAIEIKLMTVDNSLFALPENATLVENKFY